MPATERTIADHFAASYNGVGSGLTGIIRSGIAAGTADSVVINDGTGLLSSVVILPTTLGGTGLDTTGINSVFITDGTGVPMWSATLPPGAVAGLSHSVLANLNADDHLQYALLAGRVGGQTLNGGTAAGNNLTLDSTANAAKGLIVMSSPARVATIDSATTLSLGTTVATSVFVGRTGAVTTVGGTLAVESVIDRAAPGTLFLGSDTATAVDMAGIGIPTTIRGAMLVQGSIDTVTPGTMTLGATATSVQLGAIGVPTIVKGNLTVEGTTTAIDSTVINVADNFLNLNIGYTDAGTSKPGGMVVNYAPTATTGTATAFPTIITASVAGTGVFVANDIIQIGGAVNFENEGIYVVLSHVAGVLTLSTVAQGWNQTSFVVDVTVNAAVVTKVNISIMRANVTGDWEVGKGAVAPITFSGLATASSRWTFHPVNDTYSATSTTYQTIGNFAFDVAKYGSAANFLVTYYLTYTDRSLDIVVHDGTSIIGSELAVATTGIHGFVVTTPVVNKRLTVQIRKSAVSGTSPDVSSVQFDLST